MMKRIVRFTAPGTALLTLVLALAPLSAQETDWKAMKKEAKQDQVYAAAHGALDQLLKENAKARELFEKSYGWAAFDNLKIGIGISGGGGRGVAVDKKTGRKTYMEMGSAGIGLTLGGKKYQVVFLFQDSKTFNSFVNEGWQATAEASATAGKGGSGSQTNFVNGMAVFQLDTRGLMANADVSGTKYSKDDELN